jgi:SAM-dependent methyltransferase
VSDPAIFARLAPSLRELYNQITEYDFTDVEEDILKGVYQELIDIDTRHALGEYYTPDWVCERVVDSLQLERSSRVLDPACGSGSFLRALVARLRTDWPDMPVQQIANQITGIDVHPLSVQIAKTTLLLALGEGVARAKAPVTLNVYLANTLFLSQDEGKKTLYTSGHHFLVRVDDQRLPLDMTPFIGQPDRFVKAIELAQYFVDNSLEIEQPFEVFDTALRARVPTVDMDKNLVAELHAIYRAMREAKQKGRDTIWQFVLQNLYQPVFMYRVFDAIVANPPWLTYSDISSGDYQQLVRDIARVYNLMPSAKANNPHIDLAAVFLSHCGKYLAKDGAQLAFVLPRAFLTADQHANVRSGEASGFKLSEVWDLDGVSPLFNVPACVLLACASQSENDDAKRARALPKTGIVGTVFDGRLPKPHLHWRDAQQFLKEQTTRWYFQELGNEKSRKKRSALVQQRIQGQSGGNAYAERFKQGATIVPRAFYFVEPQGMTVDATTDVSGRTVNIRTHPLALEGAKKPWDGISLTGSMQGQYLFRTAMARNVIPFALINPALVALPLVKEEQATDGSAQHFLVDFAMYVCFVDSEEEARFVECYLNSGYINKAIKAFQTKCHFGARDVTKKILEFPCPNFSRNVASHRTLAALGKQVAQAVQSILGSQQDLELDPRSLGRLRTRIRSELAPQFKEMDALVEAISTGRDAQARGQTWERVLHGAPPDLIAQPSTSVSAFLRNERTHWSEREMLASGSRTGRGA